MPDLIVVIIVIAVVSVLLWSYFTAQRLNRLHIRIDAALQSLQAALDRRAAVVAVLNPDIAPRARTAESIRLLHGQLADREAAERDLSTAVRAELIPDESAEFAQSELVDADVRVELAHRFYNEAVADARALRLRPLVKALRLGGRAPLPEFFQYTTILQR